MSDAPAAGAKPPGLPGAASVSGVVLPRLADRDNATRSARIGTFPRMNELILISTYLPWVRHQLSQLLGGSLAQPPSPTAAPLPGVSRRVRGSFRHGHTVAIQAAVGTQSAPGATSLG
jgi:hypothetical protein